MNKKIIITLSILISCNIISNAQRAVTNSIEKKLLQYTKDDTVKINLLNETAYKLYQIDVNKTLKYAKEAKILADKLNFQKGKSESLRLIGIYNILRGNYSAALDYFQQSLDIAIKINDKLQISKSYNNIGLVYGFYEDYQKELECYQKSLKIDTLIGNKRGVSICYSNIGSIYIIKGDYDRALEYLQKSLKIFEELNDKAGIARSYNNIGNIYSKKNSNKKALSFLYKSIDISSKIGTKSTEGEAYKDISIIFFKQKKYKKAYSFSKKAYFIAKDLEETELLKESSEIIAKSSAKLGLYKDAYKYYVIYKIMNDSLYNDENTRKIASIELQHKYEKERNISIAEQQKKDAVRAEKEKQEKLLRNSFIIGFILMTVLVLFLYKSFLNKKRVNLILSLQKKEIEQKNENINSSISYASRIQQALLPAETFFTESFNSHFILYKPKDIVSGDFYFFKKIDNFIIIAVADCTGHGVPGAFVSMLGIAFLNEIVRKKEITTASQILEDLRYQVKTTLKDNSGKDGMDIALCLINTKTNILQFSGANNPLYIFRNEELIEIKATLNPIGYFYKTESSFKNNKFQLQENDAIYMFSDGYADQFGGQYDKKFMLTRFKYLLKSLQNKPFNEQKDILNKYIENWKGEDNSQTDDILIIGIKV